MRRLALAAVLVVLPLLLSGCVTIVEETAGQVDVIGPVQITSTFCISNNTPECPNGNSGENGGLQTDRLLLGYRIPTGTGTPASIVADGIDLTLTPDENYTRELQRLAP